MQKLTTLIFCTVLLCNLATAQNNSSFISAKQEIENMLSGKEALSYEKAIFLMENAYYDNNLDETAYKEVLDFHTENIRHIIAANTTKSLADFTPQLLNSAEKQKAKYDKALANWAIFTYLTDTTYFINDKALLFHLPYSYSSSDPLGTNDWRNTQVVNLLDTKQGNCYALVSLFKIFAERLNSEATICTAPGHIFIRHADDKGIKYFVELPTQSFPGLGTLETLTYTTDEATINNISMRTLDLQQSVALSLVYLAKGYEFKNKIKTDDFLIQCAASALNYDSLNLNAMLLKAEVLEERVLLKNKTVNQLQNDNEFKEYENLIAKLYKLGYREMPLEMKNILLSAMKGEENPEPFVDHTPKPFEHLGVKDDRYATLSWGMFEEMHEKKEKEKYSRIIFDTQKNQITEFVNADTLYNKYDFDPVVFALSVDPMAHARSWVSPYNFVQNNPINRVDPTGALDGEYEKDKAGDWKKVSTKGDEIGVDFYHTDVKNMDNKQITIVTDRKGNFNEISDGRYTLSGEQRSAETNWLTIYSEWETGTGPATSFFEGNHQTINDFKDHYTINEAFDKFQISGLRRNGYESEFGFFDIFKTGGEQKQVQMMGEYNISFYKLGDKTLTIGQDSKSRSSLYYHLPFVQNYERGVHPGNQESTTRQNYLFFK